MKLPAFSAPGQFYRSNLHTHSTLSDGVLSPAEVCRRYPSEGYDFIALTDHMIGIYDYPYGRSWQSLGAELRSKGVNPFPPNGEVYGSLFLRSDVAKEIQ